MKRNCLSLMIGACWPPGRYWHRKQPAARQSRFATNLDSIKVTARKREETLQEVPVAVTAFTSEALDKMNVQDIATSTRRCPT
jgi:iron complex outermembrane receptor protein